MHFVPFYFHPGLCPLLLCGMGGWGGDAPSSLHLLMSARSLADAVPQVYTVLSSGCRSVTAFKYLHIRNIVMASTTQTFTIALEQNNPQCLWTVAPYPATWGGVDVRRYLRSVRVNGVTTQDVYIPLSHFQIDLTRVVALSFKALFQSSVISLGQIQFTNSLPFGARARRCACLCVCV
jgi:hypothetical protein